MKKSLRPEIPRKVVYRLSVYFRGLQRLKANGRQTVSSEALAKAAGDDSLKQRTWVLLTEAVEGGWGLWGHAHTNDEIVTAAKNEIAKLKG